MTREQRKQRRKRTLYFTAALLFAIAVCAVRCLACDGAAAENDDWTRFLTVCGAAALTYVVMRAAFWLDGARK